MGYQTRNDKNLLWALGFILGVPVVGLLLVAGLTCSVAFAWWATRTYHDQGRVDALKYEHHTYRDNWQEVVEEDWEGDLHLRRTVMPVDGRGEVAGIDNIRNCYSKFHHTDRIYTGQSCSGSGKNRHCHSTYIHRPVYRDWCTYDTWKWVTVEDVPRIGFDTDTVWGEVTPGVLDRARHVGDYDVTIGYYEGAVVDSQDDRTKFVGSERFEHVAHPVSEQEYRTWHVGERVVVECYNIGFVRDVIRPEQTKVE